MKCIIIGGTDTMWITLFLMVAWFSATQALDNCNNVLDDCHQTDPQWTRCYEDRIATCKIRGRMSNFIRVNVSSSNKIEFTTTNRHRVRIPSSALQRSRGAASEGAVLLLSTVINSTYFKVAPPQRKGRAKALIPTESAHSQPTVLGGLVLLLKAGNKTVANLKEPINLIFQHSELVGSGTCVFWKEQDYGAANWSSEGCSTHQNGTEFICSCNHLSFFAVLVNPVSTVDQTNAITLSYITYIGSALSVIFTVISLIIYVFLQRRRPEKAIALHMQLTVALFCLHLSFLLGSFWVGLLKKNEADLVCKLVGLSLHWSLLATLTWTALEGFHLYLLLVRVFNIYVRRYLLKLSLVGWGVPTVIATVCGISGVYGRFTLWDADKKHVTTEICWMDSNFKDHTIVLYITILAYSCLVVLYNSCMLGLVVFKVWGIRGGVGHTESSGWKRMTKEKGSRLWKDCATVLGLSCVLGLPWGLATTTFTSVFANYIFTILNSLQGFFVFLWSLALTFKSRPDNDTSTREPSSQKMMTTSFNN